MGISAMTLAERREPHDDDMVDLVAVETIARGGTVQVTSGSSEPDVPVAAILRY